MNRGMVLRSKSVEIYVPSGRSEDEVVARTTHLGIGAHPDDLEILAIDGILRCYDSPENLFTGITMTDGAGTPRTGAYADYSDAQMRVTRADEQKRAADIGKYGVQFLLGYSSASIKDQSDDGPTADLVRVVEAAKPSLIYTHNFWDKHDTHVAVAARAIDALRRVPESARPALLYGVEVWRDLDWLPESRKVVFDCSRMESLQQALLAVFDSQITGAKRYDRAVMGRRMAHATYLDPHSPDDMTHAVYAIDMTPLIRNDTPSIAEWVDSISASFAQDVRDRVAKFTS